ncbi:Fe-Mn family superoxide dismutase [bacterium]|nr:Fe-Mn family superoxide dismutase [bacterium]
MKKGFFLLCFMSYLVAEPIQVKDYSSLKVKMPKFHPELLQIHLDLYKGYVAQVNFIDSKINTEKDPFLLQSLRKQYGFEYDGMALHELYFGELGGNGKVPPRRRLMYKMMGEYGSFAKFKEKVKSFAKIRGIGWIILFGNVSNGDIKLSWVAEHEKGFLSGWVPLCVIDLWEHAYIAQFGLNKDTYIDILFEYMDWNVVNDRYVKGCNAYNKGYVPISK